MTGKTIILTAFLALAAAPAAAEDDMAALTTDARAAIKGFAERLKAELVAAIEAGGPEAAIGVCNSVAPAIANERSAAYRGRVGRTSLKWRSPANAPDDWERAVLEDFEARKAAGEDVAALDLSAIVTENGVREFRYMKAIPTAAVCLKCHGSDLKPEVAAMLDDLYPDDRARGFKEGDIRGAFTLRKILD